MSTEKLRSEVQALLEHLSEGYEHHLILPDELMPIEITVAIEFTNDILNCLREMQHAEAIH